jgi:hypothetical protein
MFSKEGIVLGHHISNAGIKVDPANIKVIKDLPAPRSQKAVIIFLGHVGYYRRFIANFMNIATPMLKLLVKYIDFVWDSQCQYPFEDLKENLSIAPIFSVGMFTGRVCLSLMKRTAATRACLQERTTATMV